MNSDLFSKREDIAKVQVPHPCIFVSLVVYDSLQKKCTGGTPSPYLKKRKKKDFVIFIPIEALRVLESTKYNRKAYATFIQ